MHRRSLVAALSGLLLSPGIAPARALRQDATPTACPTTSEEENAAIARQFHEVGTNQRRPEKLRGILAPDVVHHAAGGYPDVKSADGVVAMMSDFPPAFSDLHYTIDLLITKDDYVVERYTATGTQDGPLGDLPPSGRKATWTGINIYRFACGRIAEIWSEVDALSRRAQLTGEAAATPVS
ncbi:MAG: ester cyclase [Thermomicrobiales bacterium]|nr:ester cyclase [Thermomicrobiales bacterium]